MVMWILCLKFQNWFVLVLFQMSFSAYSLYTALCKVMTLTAGSNYAGFKQVYLKQGHNEVSYFHTC